MGAAAPPLWTKLAALLQQGDFFVPSPRLQIELDALSQRELSTPVEGVGLTAHVGSPGVTAGLSSSAGVLFTSEGTANFGAAGADVDVGYSAV